MTALPPVSGQLVLHVTTMTFALERISVIVDRESLIEGAEGDILVDVA